MRARQPDRSGDITRGGVRVAYDVYGEGNTPTVVLLPAWMITHSGHWKAQVPVLARRYRVITVDPRGNGRSDHPVDPAAYAFGEQAADIVAVMDATGTDQATLAGVSEGGALAAVIAATHPGRVTGLAMVSPALWSLGGRHTKRTLPWFDEVLDSEDGWALYNKHVWRRDLSKFARFFWSQVFNEPHSTKQIEDGVGWTSETDAQTLVANVRLPGGYLDDPDMTLAMLREIRCPALVMHGTDDAITPLQRGRIVAETIGADFLLLEGCGHCPQARDPVRVNRALVDFIERVTPRSQRRPVRTRWTRALDRPKSVLYLSSPIGLGHARRDLAIARALRQQHPGVQIDWLAQHPVTTFLDGSGETVHPASARLVSESGHFAGEGPRT
jgi:pimeloyl-ACP methyl ester carboxylesterase